MANVLVLVSGGRSKAKVEQRTGRVLRRFAGKRGAVIYDFEDLQHPLMAKHSRLRQELYRELGYATEGRTETTNLHKAG
jgi:superfamily II DNA or RNA helicase